MSQNRTFLIFFLLSLTTPLLSQLESSFLNGFNNISSQNLTLSDGAELLQNGILRLTNVTPRVKGHAFYSFPLQFRNPITGKASSFSTSFAFAISPRFPSLGGHGLAFTISPTKKLPYSLPRQYLGLLNSSDVGNFSNHIVGVEFDTVQDLEFNDINDNHVGVDIDSLVSNKSVAASYFLDNSSLVSLNLMSGHVIQSWIDYDSVGNVLEVRLSPHSLRPMSPILSSLVDLSPILEDFMYVGFSASTGLLASSHYILGWSFTMNGIAQSLSLSSLPSLPRPKRDGTGLIVSLSICITFVLVLAVGVAILVVRKIRNADIIEAWELEVGPHRFSYKELKKATKGFRDKELLGFGGFGKVYKGILPNNNTQVAVKRVSHESKQGLREFVSEIASIGRLRHRNLVHLLGWCRRRGDLLLVYDFMPNGSLDKYLFNEPKATLNWEQRFKIIKGVASGLLYLHEEWEQIVIHRDIKAGNVLLDGELNGRLGDFGLAKLYEHDSNPSTTRVVGTLGYLAPELTKIGKPTTASDVFAFGALLLEVVSGRRPIDHKALPEELVLVEWAWEKWRSGAMLNVVDPRLNGEFDEVEVVVVLKLGLMCSNNLPNARPTMRQVVRYLEGEVPLPEVVDNPYSYDKKGCPICAGGSCNHLEFEDFMHSYPESIYFEKASNWSSGGNLGVVDVEAGTSSPFSLPTTNEFR